jgi:hypothetical protein
MTDALDLLAPDAVRDPHALMRRAREAGPIAWSERHRAWLIVGHPELTDAFGDRRLSTERMGAFLDRLPPARRDAVVAAVELLDGWMLFHEPPTHERLRAPLRRTTATTPNRSGTTTLARLTPATCPSRRTGSSPTPDCRSSAATSGPSRELAGGPECSEYGSTRG